MGFVFRRDRAAAKRGVVNFCRRQKEEAERVLNEHPSCERNANNVKYSYPLEYSPWFNQRRMFSGLPK